MAQQISLPHDFSTITRAQAIIIDGYPAIPFSWLSDNYNEIKNKYNDAATQLNNVLLYGTTDPTGTPPVSNVLYVNTTTNMLFRWDSVNLQWKKVVVDNANKVGDFTPSQTPGANKVVVAKSDGTIDTGWLGAGGLNADTVDNFHASQTPTANTVVVADSAGHLNNNWIGQLGTDNLANGIITQAKFANYAAGDYFVAGAYAEAAHGGATNWVKMKEIIVARAGTLRIKYDGKTSGETAYFNIRRNGTEVGTERSTTETVQWTTWSEDISGWSPNDLCQLYARNSGVSSSYVRNFILTSSFCVSEYVNYELVSA